ncbi:MAG: hypothetical protein ACI4RN_02220 [Oscillospiraceae bacterium]
MIKARKLIFSFILTFIAAAGICISAFAEERVTYDGNARKFIFATDSGYSPTDLFAKFKNCMPGDSILQEIEVKNDVSNNVKVKVYLKSYGADEKSQKLLSQMNLKVEQQGGSELFNSPAHETAQLSDWVYLGTVYSGGDIKLNLTLDAPITMGNEYRDSIGYVDWEFKVEELPIEEGDPKSVNTGQKPQVEFMILAGICLFTAGCLSIIHCRKRSLRCGTDIKPLP